MPQLLLHIGTTCYNFNPILQNAPKRFKIPKIEQYYSCYRGITCIYIWSVWNILECFMFFDFFVMCYIIFHFDAKRVYIWLYLESVKYSGMLYFFWSCVTPFSILRQNVHISDYIWNLWNIHGMLNALCFFAFFVTTVLHLLPRLHREVCRCQGHQTLRRRGLRRLWRFRGTARAVTAYDGQKDGDGRQRRWHEESAPLSLGDPIR